MNAPRGTTYTFSATVWDEADAPINALTLTLTLYDPSYAVVAGFPVSGLTHDGTGRYHYDWAVPAGATLGTYTAAWSGTIADAIDPVQANLVVAGAEYVTVTVAGSASSYSGTPLLSGSELSAFQSDFVGLVMTTPVIIYHQTLVTPVSNDNDYGDDDVRYMGSTTAGSPVETVAWIVNKPSVDAIDNAGMIQTVSPGIMRMPIGTSVFPGDRVDVGDEQFVIIDTNNDDTWPNWLIVTFQSPEAAYAP